MNDPLIAERHGKAGLKKAQTPLCMEAMVNAYLRIYDCVLTTKQRRATTPVRVS
jgi:hypothetical protein